MRLVWFTLHGYKRFAAAAKLNLDSRLIAVTGPNEAGKSSLLDALMHLNHDEPLTASELTRRTTIPDDQRILRAEFLLESADVQAIRHLNGGGDARWFSVTKLQSGEVRTGIEPQLTRDLRSRVRAVTALRRLLPALERAEARATPADEVEEGLSDAEAAGALTAGDVRQLADDLDVELNTLPPATLERLAEVTAKLKAEAEDYGATGRRGLAAVGPLAEHEAEHPNDSARQILFERRPRFLPFAENERTLNSEYDLVDEVPSLPATAALRNLAALAAINLDSVRDAVIREDWGLVDTLTAEANARLAERFRVSWRQSDLTVRFRIDERLLRMLIETPHEPASRLDERSDGMRAFIALLAYTALHGEGPPPVLLIDEAETHLHYAAQADLVQVMTEQTAAAQIIYTTHSAVCLPEDIGTGVRLIVPLEGPDRSRVQNWFWEEEPGLSPLLSGMGFASSAFAFTPTRFAVFAEGPTELVLLPALLREATQQRTLGFQVAPGLALVNRRTASSLELEAARVAYVVDSDRGGRGIARVLRQGGVAAEYIFELRDGSDDGLTVEDFVDAETYRAAVNEELRRSGMEHEVPRQTIPARGRVAALAGWCAQEGIGEPRKVGVALRVVEMREQRRLVAAGRRRALQRLYAQLRRRLGIDDAIAAGRL